MGQRGLTVEYFPANPSTMVYLNGERPVLPSEVTCDSFCANTTILRKKHDFQNKPSGRASDCSSYNHWGYGLEGVKAEYVEQVSDDVLFANFASRDVTYLSGS